MTTRYKLFGPDGRAQTEAAWRAHEAMRAELLRNVYGRLWDDK